MYIVDVDDDVWRLLETETRKRSDMKEHQHKDNKGKDKKPTPIGTIFR